MKYTLCGDCRYAGLGLWYQEYAQKHVDVAQMQLHNMWNCEKWQELDIYPHITSKLKKQWQTKLSKNWTDHVVRHICWKTLPTNYVVKHICQALRWKVSRGNHLLQILSASETMFFNCQLVSLGISGAIVKTKCNFFKSSQKIPN